MRLHDVARPEVDGLNVMLLHALELEIDQEGEYA